MKWKVEAIERLKSYECASNALESLRLMVKELEMDVYSPPASRMDSPISADWVYEDFRINRLVTLELLRERVKRNETWLEAMDKALEMLDPVERQSLDWFYIRPGRGSLEEICREMGMERSSLYRLRDRALEKFTLALFGID